MSRLAHFFINIILAGRINYFGKATRILKEFLRILENNVLTNGISLFEKAISPKSAILR